MAVLKNKRKNDMPTWNDVLDALGLMLILTSVSIVITVLVVYGLYWFFKNRSDEKPDN